MFFGKFVIESENGVLVLRLKDGFGYFVLLQLRLRILRKFGVYCYKWTANSSIFDHKKFTVL